nr:uncharacterized protein LOC111429270 [Onthophagus taurus]XP_022920908.1 uncharacterized protein LOC111429270 [Onthophagus taurus]XP_022920909.1 uncharacterized protein LOC111429270 [Onthophagus taurus]
MGLRVKRIIESLQLNSMKLSGKQWVVDSNQSKIGNQYVFFTDFMKGIVYRDTDCSYAGIPLTKDDEQRKLCQLDNRHVCTGMVYCNSGTSSANIYICYHNADINRRYDYVLLEKDELSLKCSGEQVVYNFKENCRDCLCYCEEPNSNSTNRFISLDEMVTNTAENKIITGVRLNKYKGVITIDIRESQLNCNGYIQADTTKWIINKGNTYFKLTNPDKVYIKVGELKIDDTKVVTGVRFIETENGVELQMRVNEHMVCDGTTLFSTTKHEWVSKKPKRYESVIIDLTGLDLPTKAEENELFKIKSFNDKRIRVAPTSFTSDGAQTVIPFFDIRPVITIPPIPIRGVGLAYKSANSNNGGYIAPYIVVADFSKNIDINNLKKKMLLTRRYASKSLTLSAEIVVIIINCFILFTI